MSQNKKSQKKNKNIGKLVLILAVTISAIYIFRSTSLYQHITELFTSNQKLTEYITKRGKVGPVVFFLLQIVQVIVSPIPGNITTILGGNIFGLKDGLILNMSSIFIGSLFAYFLARFFGQKLVLSFIGDTNYNKYFKIFNKKSKMLLLAIFLLPFFPDDMFCFLAGLSLLSFRSYFMLLIIGRMPVIALQTFIGTGLLHLNMSGWIVVGLISLVLLYIVIRYGKSIEEWFYRKLYVEV